MFKHSKLLLIDLTKNVKKNKEKPNVKSFLLAFQITIK